MDDYLTRCETLTADRWQRLLDDNLTREETTLLRDHLATECDACDQFFMEMNPADEKRLRLVLRNLVETERAGAGLTRPDFNSVLKGIRKTGISPEGHRKQRSWVFALSRASALGALILIVLGGLIYSLYESEPDRTMKGPASLVESIDLQFAVGHRAPDNSLKIDRGTLGAEYRNSERLFLRYRFSSPGHVYLLWYQEGSGAQWLHPANQETPPARQDSGEYYFPASPVAGGLSLKDRIGRQVVVAIHSPRPLRAASRILARLEQAMDQTAQTIDLSRLESIDTELAFSSVDFEVHE